MKTIVSLLVVVLFVTSCNNRKNKIDDHMSYYEENVQESTDRYEDGIHNAENSLDYYGTYKGTFPGADNPGIKTTLTLHKDQSYTLESVYTGKEDNKFEEKGDFSVDGNTLTLYSKTGQNQYFKVEEGRLRKLDDNQQVITGSLAEDYILTKE